ncbi:MAG: NAD(P)H-hydrate epimerase, partial [Clostridia bacterium]|nr:NAD(P)H-hydrate epimerase [Clostridia bacterium]
MNKSDYEKQAQAVTVEQMRNADAYTIANFVPSKELMYRAAMGIYNSYNWYGKKIAIVAGSGNNGGDGYALAGILAENGVECTIYRVSGKFSSDGGYYYNIAIGAGVRDVIFNECTDFEGYDVIVDCILGTGFHGVPEGNVKCAIEKINDSSAYVIS